LRYGYPTFTVKKNGWHDQNPSTTTAKSMKHRPRRYPTSPNNILNPKNFEESTLAQFGGGGDIRAGYTICVLAEGHVIKQGLKTNKDYSMIVMPLDYAMRRPLSLGCGMSLSSKIYAGTRDYLGITWRRHHQTPGNQKEITHGNRPHFFDHPGKNIAVISTGTKCDYSRRKSTTGDTR